MRKTQYETRTVTLSGCSFVVYKGEKFQVLISEQDVKERLRDWFCWRLIELRIIGFIVLHDAFVVGCGLDLAKFFREMPFVGVPVKQ